MVFLDVDNEAIAVNGVFPWPRSVMADGLLRIKEFDVAAVIFDIEYVDKSPRGLDTVNLNYLPLDFDRAFSEIDSSTSELIKALLEGRLARTEVFQYLSAYIADERQALLEKALSVARDNDEYLAAASALYGRSWVTLNLRTHPLEGEQASRRAVAEELFSYPVKINNNLKESFVDILPPIISFAKAAKGAGFTRAYVDNDGVRRRIDLVQEVNGHCYLQLAFAPLVNYLGNPDIELEKGKLKLRSAKLPSGETRDISIPLDREGRMLLDWPLEDYVNSYTHFSFAALSRLAQNQADIERLVGMISSSENLYTFISLDNTLSEVPALLYRVEDLFKAANKERERALAETSDEAFNAYLAFRNEAWEMLYYFKDLEFSVKIKTLGDELALLYPDQAEVITEEINYLWTLAHNMISSLDNFDIIHASLGKALKGKFCVVGQTDAGTTDIGVNPFHQEYVNVGTHGVVSDTILSESFIVWLSHRWSALFCIITPIVIFFSTRFAPGLRASASLCFAIMFFFLSFFLFRFAGVFLDPICLIFSLISAAAVREITFYVVADKERQFIHKAFSTYVSGDVVKEIVADPSRLQLGGAKRHMSAMFTDIQGFSTISEKLDPEDLVKLLNRYLTAMSNVVLEQKGTIDKYEGDAIIAFFGAPLELPDHALRICLSAITMKRLEAELNESLLAQNLTPAPLKTRIGITTGSMVAGNMGTENKMNYTIMGNTVNLAARLEGVNKFYGTWILTTHGTLSETNDRILSRRLDKVRVVGINEPVQLYELLETMEAATEKQKETVLLFEKALALYESRDWKNAANAFQYTLDHDPDDPPSKIFLKRCETYVENPPPKNWDGVMNLDRK